MQINPQLKAAIIELIEKQGGRLQEDKGGLVKVIYGMLPNMPWKPAPGNENVIRVALEQLAEQGRIKLDRNGRKLYAAQHQRRHEGPGNIIATPTEVDPDAAFEVELVVPPTVEELVEQIATVGPHDVARDLLRLVVQIARTPVQDPAELDGLKRKLQERDREVKRLAEAVEQAKRQASGDAAELRTAKADIDDLRKGNLEMTELLAVAEAERDEWKRRATEATLEAARYRTDFAASLRDQVDALPGSVDTILGLR